MGITETVQRWSVEYADVMVVGTLLALCVACAYTMWQLNDGTKQLREWLVARKERSRRVSDVTFAALQDAASEGKITEEDYKWALRKLAQVPGFTDLSPKPVYDPPNRDLNRTRLFVTRRLEKAGVDIKAGLNRIKEMNPLRKTDKKAKLLASLSKRGVDAAK